MKLIFDSSKYPVVNVSVKLPSHKPKFMFEKQPGYKVARRSRYSFVYQNQLYNMKNNTVKENNG